jgi:CheY-like chemotaxis protein
MQLSAAGASVVTALNGKIAVKLAATQQFDLILMDMQMPVLDGYAATAELRRKGTEITHHRTDSICDVGRPRQMYSRGLQRLPL